MVKALKGDELKGYFETTVDGKSRKFDKENIGDFLRLIPNAMAKAISATIKGRATLVPIPNSHVTRANSEDFKTYELAKLIAERSGGNFTAVPALVFKEPQVKSRNGGPRNPFYFERAYRVIAEVEGPIVLIDDVCTTGGHLIGACWKLQSPKREVILACAFGSSTKTQNDKPLGRKIETLSLTKPTEEFL